MRPDDEGSRFSATYLDQHAVETAPPPSSDFIVDSNDSVSDIQHANGYWHRRLKDDKASTDAVLMPLVAELSYANSPDESAGPS